MKDDLTATGLTMSSLEIAGLTGKDHRHILRDIRKMLTVLRIPEPKFGLSYRGDDGKDHPAFKLPKRETTILVSGYSVEMRARIIDRWIELEAIVAGPHDFSVTGMTQEMRKVVGGIVKSVCHAELAEYMAVFDERLDAMKVAPTFDYASTVTSSMIIEMAGILPGQRARGTSNVVTHAMLDFCSGIGCVKTAAELNQSRPWRFPTEKAREWLFGSHLGAEQIRNQIARRNRAKAKPGQGSFRLVPNERAEPGTPVA